MNNSLLGCHTLFVSANHIKAEKPYIKGLTKPTPFVLLLLVVLLVLFFYNLFKLLVAMFYKGTACSCTCKMYCSNAPLTSMHYNVLQCITMYYNVLQCSTATMY